jgi:hypothetical protein
MSSNRATDLLEELRGLLAQLCEGSLDGPGYRRIEALVRNGPTERQLYLDTILLHGELRWASAKSPSNLAANIADSTGEERLGRKNELALPLPSADCFSANLDPGNHNLDVSQTTLSPDGTGAAVKFSIPADPAADGADYQTILLSLQRFFLRGTVFVSRAAAILILVGTLCAGVLLGALAVAAVPQWREDGTHANSEVTLLGSTGAGFTTAIINLKHGSVNPNSASPTLPETVPTNYVHTVSNEALALFGATPKRIIWQLRFTGGLLDKNPGNRRVVLGLRAGETPAANLFLPGSDDPAQAGLWVFLTNGVNITPYTIQLATHGNLVFVNAAGEALLLATWDWAKFDMSAHPNITVNLDTSATHYALSFDQEVVNLVGALSGQLPSEAPTSVRIGVFDQIGEGDVPGSVIVDRIAIANVPAKDSRTFGDASISNVGSKVAE